MGTGVMAYKTGWLAALLLAALTAFAMAQDVSSLDGDWDGTLTVSAGLKLRLALHAETHDGATSAVLFSVDRNNARIPVTAITRDGGILTLTVPAAHGSFTGTLSANTFSGTWTQGASLPLTFVRRPSGMTGPPALKRPQEPKPPFPYKSEDVTFAGPGGITLAATLTTPEGAGPFLAVVLAQGSGPHDRDETIMGHKPFWVLADALTRRGIAVLRADKRGIGKSTGDYANATSGDFAADTEASVAYLRSLKNVAPKKVGLIGHSEGGMIAPMVAAADPDIAFIVLMAGPGLKGEDILLMQQRLIGQAMGISPDTLAKATALNRQVYEAVLAEKDANDAKAKVTAIFAANNVPANAADAGAATATSPWFRFFLSYDPAPTLRQVKCPVLAIDGSLDLQVPPKEDLAAIKAALSANPDATVKELPGLNHLFQTAKTGAPGEYGEIEETIAPAALAVVGDWIVERTR
jgi:hypothetical protein